MGGLEGLKQEQVRALIGKFYIYRELDERKNYPHQKLLRVL